MPFKHKIKINVRFSDVDAFQHVNNARYLTYFEEARVDYFDRIVGWNYDSSKCGIILAKAEIDYIQPAHFKDDLFVETRCSRIGTKSFDLEYRMTRNYEGKEILLSDGCTVMVAFDYTSRKSIPVPEIWKKAILDFEGDGVLIQ
ncbi:MAG: acyl-CoA thioesterase [Bacteroidia bacterium]|nr:acyl-CoA thioesterase [Bacteroidia bacterium]